MGAKASTASRVRTYSGSAPSGHVANGSGSNGGMAENDPRRNRARSFGNVTGNEQSMGLPSSADFSPDSDSSAEGAASRILSMQAIGSGLPFHLIASPSIQGVKCPVCSKVLTYDEFECHLVICLTKPRLTYNEDVLSQDAGECVICLEDMEQGDTIARLPCLCIYHKQCIDKWFEKNRSCPEHPSD